MLAQIIVVHQQDFGTAIDYRPHSEAILRRIGSPMADRVAEILQQVERIDREADRLGVTPKSIIQTSVELFTIQRSALEPASKHNFPGKKARSCQDRGILSRINKFCTPTLAHLKS